MVKIISKQEEKKLKNSLTELELKQIKNQRAFEEIEVGSPRFRIGLMMDSYRKNIRTYKTNIEKIICYIRNTQQTIARLQFQLDSGKITEELKEGITMNADEVKLEIDLKRNLIDKEREQILLDLWNMSVLVGRIDVMQNVILSEEEFNSYFESVEITLKELGIKLIEDL